MAKSKKWEKHCTNADSYDLGGGWSYFFFMCACGSGGPNLAREQAMASHRYFFSFGAYELCLLLNQNRI